MPWQKGQSGNPRGRPVGARDELSNIFLKELLDDYRDHGAAAIVKLRDESPGRYVELIAKLLPRYVHGKHAVTHFTEPLSVTDRWLEEVLQGAEGGEDEEAN